MIDHLKNLRQYVEDDITYSRYKERPEIYYDNYEKMMIEHCKDIEWAIDELEALYGIANKYLGEK